ncbi:23S rRNA maturation-related 3'-5' exoribonuclease YhaM [Clostridium acetobutylicum]|nr:23S rRNA maturation-related 3'-5' exoribonuclease YhaM [Clostridium acetobutylicum]
MNEIKYAITRLLLSTERQGIHNLIGYMESKDFFQSTM